MIKSVISNLSSPAQDITIFGELTRERVYSQMGEFDQGTKIGKLRTVVLDNNNIIEYI